MENLPFMLKFFRQVEVAFVFFRTDVSVICFRQKQKVMLSISRLAHDQYRVKMSHEVRNVERGSANQPLWHKLGWPSSYVPQLCGFRRFDGVFVVALGTSLPKFCGFRNLTKGASPHLAQTCHT